ncbi:MAG: NACHT domain-containing protein [Mojavia pulchra JT2-VF2]|jgi:energy-coupling factor transporter ATP-binding protein EcfA2|uniref:NACHT domain-containing protein n=1 Tax=Mojavia pulchra JT2-VF2 TaxID=287848 RepID=A0A951Q759_9NOST|nr:NACHT domain-containing protein [Mojavia pulchra JT2-VF2]
MSQINYKRKPFVVNAITGEELKAGNRDVGRIYYLLVDDRYGCCEADMPAKQIHNRLEFMTTFSERIDNWNPHDQLIFYFSGHGDLRNGEYCLKLGLKESDWHPFDSILNELKMSNVTRAILIIDACRSGAVVGIKGSNDDDNTNDAYNAINKDKIPQGIAIIASSLASQVSIELDNSSYSLFTHLLCEGIESGLDGKHNNKALISIEDIVAYISHKLTTEKNYSKYFQRPIFQIGKAHGEIWLTKNISGSVHKQPQQPSSTLSIPRNFCLHKYQQSIKETYGSLKLDSLDTSGYAYNELKLWRMFIPQNVREVHQFLPQIYELPKEEQKRLLESNQLDPLSQKDWEKYQQAYYRQFPRWVFEIWNDSQNSRYVVILGDPGSGKSTLLQYMALEWAESPSEDLSSLPIPLLIELRTYIRKSKENKCKDFLEFFDKANGIIHRFDQHQLHEYLTAGKAILMFDGLDEVFAPEERQDVINDIYSFTKEYPQVRVIVTSRVIGYKPQLLRDAGFRHFMLQDLEQYQIDDFIHRWHELTFNDEAEKIRKRERLKAAINTSSAIQQLAGNPLLLTMMAILNRNQELPKDRAELYNQASRVLLHQWDVERTLVDQRLDPLTIDYKDKQAILRHIAYHMQATEQGLTANLIVSNDLENILTDYLKRIEVVSPKAFAKLMTENLRVRNFILCFLGADYYAFVHRTFLEYFCAWEFVWQFEKERTISIEDLTTNVFGKHYNDDAWQEVLRLIAGMIQPKFVEQIILYLINIQDDKNEFFSLFLAAKIIYEVRNPADISDANNQVFEKLKELAKNDSVDNITRIQAISVIYNNWKNSSKVLSLCIDMAQSKVSPSVSKQAVKILAEIAQESSEALSSLKTISQSGNEIAIEELARIKNDDPETIKILQTFALAANPVAINELVRIGGDVPSTLPILKKILSLPIDEDLKYSVIGALIRHWKHDSDILPILKKLARSGNKAAIRGLAQTWTQKPEALSIIEQLARSGNKVAIEELAWNWHEHPSTLDILKEIAQSGNLIAAIELLLLGKIDIEIFDFLVAHIHDFNYKKFIDYDSYKKFIEYDIINDLENFLITYSYSLREFILNKTDDELITIQLNKLRMKKRGIELDQGHFSTLRTKIKNSELLKAALSSLGITVKTDADVRGSNQYRVRCDIVAVMKGRFDLGWSINSDGSYNLICDLWGIGKTYNQTELINSINQRYAAMAKGYKRFVK